MIQPNMNDCKQAIETYGAVIAAAAIFFAISGMTSSFISSKYLIMDIVLFDFKTHLHVRNYSAGCTG